MHPMTWHLVSLICKLVKSFWLDALTPPLRVRRRIRRFRHSIVPPRAELGFEAEGLDFRQLFLYLEIRAIDRPTPMERVITRTLAEIYLEQGHLQEAYEIYKVLSERDPLNEELQKRRRALEARLGLDPSSQATSSPASPTRSAEERIRILRRWLQNLQERKEPCAPSPTIEE